MIETKIHNNFNHIVQIMVKNRGLGRALGWAIGKALGRRQASDDDNDARSGEGLPHLPTDSDNRSVLLRILLRSRRNWTKSSMKHLLRILLLMLRVFQADPMTHQFWDIMKITLLWEPGMERYAFFKKQKACNLQLNIFLHGQYYYLQERPELKVSSHGRKMAKFRRLAPEIEGLVGTSRLSPLIKD